MKIGRRNFTSFKDFLIQFQQYAIYRPWLAAIDVVIFSMIIVAISLMF